VDLGVTGKGGKLIKSNWISCTVLINQLNSYSDCFIRVVTALLEYFNLYTKIRLLAPVSSHSV